MRVHEPYNLYWPKKYANALRLLFDPERIQLAGCKRFGTMFCDYSNGGLIIGGNLLYNGNVERGDGPDGGSWSAYNGHKEQEDNVVHSGNYSYKVILDHATYNSGNIYYDIMNVDDVYGLNVGDFVRVGFWFHKGNLESGVSSGKGVKFTLYQYDGSSWHDDNHKVIALSDIPDDRWYNVVLYTKVEYTLRHRVQIGIQPNDGAGDGTYFYVDDFSMQKIVNGSHGIMMGKIEQTGFGHSNYLMRFDGYNDFIDLGDFINVGDKYILFAWLKAATKSHNHGTFGRGSGRFRYGLRYYSGNTIYHLPCYISDSNYMNFSFSDWLNWHLFVIVRDYDNIRAFVDNSEITSINKDFPNPDCGFEFNMIGRIHTSEYYAGDHGLAGVFSFDELPEDYEDIIHDIWNQTKSKYGL